MRKTHTTTAVFVLASLMFGACSNGPRPIQYGAENGAYCKMGISDNRYGAELVTKTGKIYTFDSVECLASFYLEGQVPREKVASLWVTDFQNPPALVRVDDAFFLLSDNLRSPMGMNLTGFSHAIGEEAVGNAFAGDIIGWKDVLRLVEERLADGGLTHEPTGSRIHFPQER